MPMLLASVLSAEAMADDNSELTQIKQQIEAMRSDYEQRIAALEARLAQAEERATQTESESAAGNAPQIAASPSQTYDAVTSGNRFNPQMSLIVNGNYYHDGVDGQGQALAGEAYQPSHSGGHGGHDDHGHGSGGNGFNLSEVELAFSATIDPWFDGSVYLAVDGDGDVDLEEAWVQTRMLPYGLKAKGGKFLSDFGYINVQHPHQWDFADQNLPYLNLFGDHGLQETGLQLTWLPDWPVYTLIGAELAQGDQEVFGAFVDDGEEREETGLDNRDSGPNLWTVFAKVSPDLGYDHALQLGVSYAHNRQHQEIHEEDGGEVGLQGDASMWGLDLVYKYDGSGGYGHRDFKLQSEYLRSIKDLRVSGGDTMDVGAPAKMTTDGIYVQGVYGIWPRWQLGVRYDALGLTNRISGWESGSFGKSDRWTGAVTWVPSEYSKLRLQYEYSNLLVAEDEREKFNAVWLQGIFSLGAHGAHGF